MEKFEKMKKISTVVGRFLKIIRALCIVVAIVTALAVVLFVAFSMMGNEVANGRVSFLDSTSLEMEDIHFELNKIEIPRGYMIGFITAAVLTAEAAVCLCIYMICQLQKVFRPMAEGRPFDVSVSRAIRNMAWGVLIGGGMMQLLKMTGQVLQYKMLSMDTLFLNSQIKSCTLDLTFELQYIVWAGLLLLLSYVFTYGEELQRQADETL